MALRDPISAYNASSNVEAHMVCALLLDAGIEAVVVEETPQAGAWGWVGPLSEMHKPQVWIERADIVRAGPILTDYEKRLAERRAADQGASGEAGPPIEVVCEECGKRSEFPAAQKGSDQNCPHCRAYVDVGDDVGFEGWDAAPDEASPGDFPTHGGGPWEERRLPLFALPKKNHRTALQQQRSRRDRRGRAHLRGSTDRRQVRPLDDG